MVHNFTPLIMLEEDEAYAYSMIAVLAVGVFIVFLGTGVAEQRHTT